MSITSLQLNLIYLNILQLVNMAAKMFSVSMETKCETESCLPQVCPMFQALYNTDTPIVEGFFW